jgi:transcriptional regulator with XRE-family HTH domain
MNKKIENKESAERLKYFRRAIGLSQEKFSKELGFSKPAYVRYEAGNREIPSRLMAEMSKKYNLSIVWLLFGEGGMFSPEDAKSLHLPQSISGGDKDPNKKEFQLYEANLIKISDKLEEVQEELERIKSLIREVEKTINEVEKRI